MNKKPTKKQSKTTTVSKQNKPKKRNIKERVKPKYTKEDIMAKIITISLILIIFVIIYFTLGVEIAALAILGTLGITVFALLLRKIKNKKFKRRIINFIIIFTLTIGILGLVAFSSFLLYIKKLAEPRFKPDELNKQELTILYDINNKEFAKLGTEKREKVKYEELPEVLVDAIIATEDSRFFQHNGFDGPRFFKASLGQVLGKDAGGASTLTMQVAKNVFTDKNLDSGIAGIIRKFEDIYLSIFKLEKNYTKQDIIEFYVNNHFLGGNIYGVEEAAQTYFGKHVQDLNLSEAAIIAGMFKSPNYYKPNTNPENAENRRSTVLSLMKRHGYISEEERKLANSIPVNSLTVSIPSNINKYQGYIDTVADEIERKYEINPYKTSLKVYTNLDRSKQDGVNSVFNGESFNWVNDKVQAGTAVLDSATGKILAIGNGRYIGNRKRENERIYNYATDIPRQPGSTAKPLFDYAPGIEYNNWSTYTLFKDEPYHYSTGQKLNNWDGKYNGVLTLRRALATSRNVPALKAFQQVDNKKIIEFVTGLGIKPEIHGGRIHEAHSIGAFTGTNPLEMSAAYAAFSNGGYYNEPYSVRKIEFRSTGKVEEHKQVRRKVMSEATAFMISSVLQDVELFRKSPYNVALKTGTTNYDKKTMQRHQLPYDAIRDSWIIGYSTKTVVGMWYGYDFIDKHYCSRNTPATIQRDLLFKALVDSGAMESNREQFKQPSSVVKLAIAKGSNPPKLAGPGTNEIIYEYFKKGHEPEEIDNSSIEKPGNLKATYVGNKVTISWDKVNVGDDEMYGKFGYNIYKDGALIDWTDKTTYVYETTEPLGTYKVIGTYKSFSGIQSEPAIYELEKNIITPEPPTPPIPNPSPSPSPSTPQPETKPDEGNENKEPTENN